MLTETANTVINLRFCFLKNGLEIERTIVSSHYNQTNSEGGISTKEENFQVILRCHTINNLKCSYAENKRMDCF